MDKRRRERFWDFHWPFVHIPNIYHMKTIGLNPFYILQESPLLVSLVTAYYVSSFSGDAVRVCLSNGTWLWGSWTNYTVCADNLDHIEKLVRKSFI